MARCTRCGGSVIAWSCINCGHEEPQPQYVVEFWLQQERYLEHRLLHEYYEVKEQAEARLERLLSKGLRARMYEQEVPPENRLRRGNTM